MVRRCGRSVASTSCNPKRILMAETTATAAEPTGKRPGRAKKIVLGIVIALVVLVAAAPSPSLLSLGTSSPRSAPSRRSTITRSTP